MKNKRRILFAIIIALVIVLGVGVLAFKRDNLTIGKKSTSLNAQESKNTEIGEIVERNIV